MEALVADGSGNVWVAGFTDGDLSGPSLGGRDAFVRRYPADGSEPVTYQFGSDTYDSATALAVDPAGNLWVAGNTVGDLGSPNFGGDDAFVRLYPANGSEPVTYQFGTAGSDNAVALAVDPAGNLWVAGATGGDLSGPSLGSYDAFVRLYPADGSEPVTYQFGTAESDYATALAVDPAGDLWVAGNTFGDLDGPNLGGGDAFVRLYPADGSEPVTYQFGSAESDTATALAVDPAGNLWVAGNTFGDVNGPNLGGQDAFVRLYPADGSEPVTYQFGGGMSDSATALAVDPTGNLWVAGDTSGDLNGPTLGGQGSFVRLYPADGSEPVTYLFGSDPNDSTTELAIDSAGNLWVGGYWPEQFSNTYFVRQVAYSFDVVPG